MQGISRKIWENHLLFSHYLAWRRKCGRLPKFCAEIGSQRPVLAVHGLALTLQRKNQKGPHRKRHEKSDTWRMLMTQVGQTFTCSWYSNCHEQLYLFSALSRVKRLEDDHHYKEWVIERITILLPQKAERLANTYLTGRYHIDVSSIRPMPSIINEVSRKCIGSIPLIIV